MDVTKLPIEILLGHPYVQELGYPYKVGQNFEPYKNYKVI